MEKEITEMEKQMDMERLKSRTAVSLAKLGIKFDDAALRYTLLDLKKCRLSITDSSTFVDGLPLGDFLAGYVKEKSFFDGSPSASKDGLQPGEIPFSKIDGKDISGNILDKLASGELKAV